MRATGGYTRREMFPVADVMPSRARPRVTITLVAILALVFAGELAAGDFLSRITFSLGVVPAFFSWSSLLSSLLLHAGWIHLLGNLIFLWIFGPALEERLGAVRCLALFIGCGVASGLVHVGIDPHDSAPLVGASGAISGVLGAYVVLYPESRILTMVPFDLVEVPIGVYLVIWMLLQMLSGAGALTVNVSEGVPIWSPAAGFAAGAYAGWHWRRRVPYRW
jgi:membrane associated rhomboid family serine protease